MAPSLPQGFCGPVRLQPRRLMIPLAVVGCKPESTVRWDAQTGCRAPWFRRVVPQLGSASLLDGIAVSGGRCLRGGHRPAAAGVPGISRDGIVTANSMESLEARTIAKVRARLIPFLILCFFVAYLDRVNVGFAALTMNADLGLSASAFGFGAGIFFLAYFLFEVPSNLVLERVGARKWFARIFFTWGLISGATAFIGGETGFFVVRVLLGIAEA